MLASDGGIVHLRPILPSDADALVRMHESLSDRTRYLRYFGPHPRISPRELERFTVRRPPRPGGVDLPAR